LISKGDPGFAGTMETVVSSAGPSVTAGAASVASTGASVAAGASVACGAGEPQAVAMIVTTMKIAIKTKMDFFILLLLLLDLL
jgi:hypothetical protein